MDKYREQLLNDKLKRIYDTTLERWIEYVPENKLNSLKLNLRVKINAAYRYGVHVSGGKNVSDRLSEMEEAGKEATSLIAHLKDQHGFNDEEQASQDKIMNVFKYEGRW